MPQTPHLDELDLAIANLDFPTQEQELLALLRDLPGIHSVRAQERGALVQFSAATTSKDQIAGAVQRAGYRATVFQDSASGLTGKVNY